jgi:Ca-activated chloride channel homolog
MARASFAGETVLIFLLASNPCPGFQLSPEGTRVAVTPRAAIVGPTAPNAAAPNVLRVDSALVLVPARVTTDVGASVTGLRRESFHLFEDGIEQPISYFATEDAPVSVGLLFDTSRSMKNKMGRASEATRAFFNRANPEDEFFLVEFNDRPKLVVPFTANADQLYRQILHSKPSGQTSLFDAIQVALKQMKAARNSRKALLIVSDGGDNWSHHTFREIRRTLLESDVQVYAMGIFDPDYLRNHPAEERKGPLVLEDLAQQTGGRHYPVAHPEDLPAIGAQIGRDLRDEYLLGYYSSNPRRDGKYRQIILRLAAPEHLPPLRTDYRRGYYSPGY